MFISFTTREYSKYSQHNQVQKRAAKVHNTTKYRNVLQIVQTTMKMFPGDPISDKPGWDRLIDCKPPYAILPSKGRRQSPSERLVF